MHACSRAVRAAETVTLASQREAPHHIKLCSQWALPHPIQLFSSDRRQEKTAMIRQAKARAWFNSKTQRIWFLSTGPLEGAAESDGSWEETGRLGEASGAELCGKCQSCDNLSLIWSYNPCKSVSCMGEWNVSSLLSDFALKWMCFIKLFCNKTTSVITLSILPMICLALEVKIVWSGYFRVIPSFLHITKWMICHDM